MIKIEELAFSYGKNQVLNNITTTLEGGRIYGLLGENGVGKTTLLTLLCGWKKPQEGRIEADGRDPYSRNPRLLSKMYYLPDTVLAPKITADSLADEYGALYTCFRSWDAFL
mgnify:CR=1 FL=1